MEKHRKIIVRGFIGGLLGVILSAGIAWAGPAFDPHTAKAGLPQCKADLASCITNLRRFQPNYDACMNDLEGCTANLLACEADLAACLQTTQIYQIQITGQIKPYGERDDGTLQMGLMWPSPRFTDNNNGTVTDNSTGLIWTKNASLFSAKVWGEALVSCNGLASGPAYGLNDGSRAGDWRLPNVKELQSLIDYGEASPALPGDHPFADVQMLYYWSSTTYDGNTGEAWFVSLNNGSIMKDVKGDTTLVWCVRSGQ